MSYVTFLFFAFGLVVFILGLQTLVFAPLALYFEFWKRRFLSSTPEKPGPTVSVIVPAYNEEETILEAVESILASDYSSFEVIVVNDGSTDGTEVKLRALSDGHKIVYIRRPNGGKASALNRGILEASGDVIVFTDADSFFGPDTLRNLARWFTDGTVDAVSGNDEPMHPVAALQKLLVLTTHIGSGFVRRALSVLRVLPVISGNIGAVRKDILEKVHGFSDMWGEDLDLTFKLHKAGARIVFDPDAKVFCEVPSSVKALWRQRVRWMRSFLKICALHRDLFFSIRYAPFSLYLPVNWLNMVVVPLLQIVALGLLPFVVHQNSYAFNGVIDVIAYSGIAIFFGISVFGILLDRSFHHLKYLPLYGWLIVPFSYFYNAVLTYSIVKEARGAAEEWQKVERRRVEQPGRKRMYAALAGICASIALIAFPFIFLGSDGRGKNVTGLIAPADVTVAVATHFDAWGKPEDAIQSIVDRKELRIVHTVGIEAGRVEWNFFRWQGHESSWSNDQKASRSDILGEAVDELRSEGKRTVAILDFYAPSYLKKHPEAAAIDVEGHPSQEQVCFMELTDGEYGREIVAMATYLASHYALDGISLTELEYSRYCYDERCLASFGSSAHHKNWPHHFFSSSINKEDHELGEWRSRRMAAFLKVIADSVHKYGKRLYVDVPAYAGALEVEGLQSGLYYPALLQFADGLIVWDYFYLEGRPASSSVDVARFFTTRYDPGRIIMSIGLWGKGQSVSPDELSEAVRYSILGGAKEVWITPNHLMTNDHWKKLEKAVTGSDRGSRQT